MGSRGRTSQLDGLVMLRGRQYELECWQEEASEARLRKMNLADMALAQVAFDPYVAAKRTHLQALYDQDRLEMLYMAEPGKLRYVIGLMLGTSQLAYTRDNTMILWHGYACRVFKAAVEAGNPEACAIVSLWTLAEFAKKSEKRRRRADVARKRAEAMPPDRRKETARKAAETRKRNQIERPAARAAIAAADTAMDEVFSVAAQLVQDG